MVEISEKDSSKKRAARTVSLEKKEKTNARQSDAGVKAEGTDKKAAVDHKDRAKKVRGSQVAEQKNRVRKVRTKKSLASTTWGDVSARAVGRRLRVSPQKLNVVAGMIRGMSVSRAQSVLAFSVKRIARDVRKILLSAVANAEHNMGMDVGKLHVREASVGRALVMRRLDIKGRSRSGRIEKPLSHLRIVVSEIKN